MTAATVLGLLSLLLGMSGEGIHAVSAYTQLHMKEAPRLRRLPETECPTIWIRRPRNRRPANWDMIDDSQFVRRPVGRIVVAAQTGIDAAAKTIRKKVKSWDC